MIIMRLMNSSFFSFFILLIVTGEEGSNPTTERNGRRAK